MTVAATTKRRLAGHQVLLAGTWLMWRRVCVSKAAWKVRVEHIRQYHSISGEHSGIGVALRRCTSTKMHPLADELQMCNPVPGSPCCKTGALAGGGAMQCTCTQQTSGTAPGSRPDIVLGCDGNSVRVVHNTTEVNKTWEPVPLQQCAMQQQQVTSAANLPVPVPDVPLQFRSDQAVFASPTNLDPLPRRLVVKSEGVGETEDLPVDAQEPHATTTAATGSCTASLSVDSECNVKATPCEDDQLRVDKSKDRRSHQKLPARQQKHHSKKIIPPWRPSGSAMLPLTSCSVHFSGNECEPGMTRKTNLAATATSQAAGSTESAIKICKSTLSHVQSSGQGDTGPGVTHYSVSQTHMKKRARSLPPSWSPGESGQSNTLLPGDASSCIMYNVRAQSTSCSPTGSMPPQHISNLGRCTAEASAHTTTHPNPELSLAWGRLAACQSKSVRCWSDCWLVDGSRAPVKKEWTKEDFAAASRLGFELQAAISSHAKPAVWTGLREEVKAHRIPAVFGIFWSTS